MQSNPVGGSSAIRKQDAFLPASELPVIRPEPSVKALRSIQHNDRQTPEYIRASLSHVQGRRSFCDWVHSGPVRVLSPQDPDDRPAALRATFCKSLVAETEMFMDHVRQNRTTKPYAQGHITYTRNRSSLQSSRNRSFSS
jgi:hypothetical protein